LTDKTRITTTGGRDHQASPRGRRFHFNRASAAILLCTAALGVHAQVVLQATAYGITNTVTPAAAKCGQLYNPACTVSVTAQAGAIAQGGSNMTASLGANSGSNSFHILGIADAYTVCGPQGGVCSPSGSYQSQSSSAYGTILDVITFVTPGVKRIEANFSASASIWTQSSSNFDPRVFTCVASGISSGPAGDCALTSNASQSASLTTLVPNSQAVLFIQVDGSIAQGLVTLGSPLVTVDGSIDSITALDKNGLALSKVSYTTASGQPLPIMNGAFIAPLYNVNAGINWSSIENAGTPGPFGLIYSDPSSGKLYVPEAGSTPHIRVVALDSLTSAGEIAGVNAAAVTVSTKSGHGFSSSNPVMMWDAASLRVIKSIPLERGVTPGAIILDSHNEFVYLFHQEAPLVTVLRASDGSTVGQIALNGIAKEAVTDDQGNIYAGIQSTDSYNVEILSSLPTGALGVTGRWTLGAGNVCSGLAMDGVNGILFATCATRAEVSSKGAPASSLIELMAFRSGVAIPNSAFQVFGASVGAVFNRETGEVFSLQIDGTMTIVKEVDPATFQEERFLNATTLGVKSLALDSRTGKVFYTGEGAISADLTGRYLYELVK
jgi:hypothetical protein